MNVQYDDDTTGSAQKQSLIRGTFPITKHENKLSNNTRPLPNTANAPPTRPVRPSAQAERTPPRPRSHPARHRHPLSAQGATRNQRHPPGLENANRQPPTPAEEPNRRIAWFEGYISGKYLQFAVGHVGLNCHLLVIFEVDGVHLIGKSLE